MNDRMIFFSSFDSALGTDSFDTKINDFDENFGEYDIDGRPFSEAKSRDTQNSNVSQPIQPFDPSFKSPPLTNYDEISKSKNPRLSPVGPDSFVSKSNTKTYTTQLNPPPKSNSIDLPDSLLLPKSRKFSPECSLNSHSPLCPNINKSDSFNTKQNKLSNQIIDLSTTTSTFSSRSTDSDYSDDEIDARPKDIHVDGSEIILKADTHYNPMNDKNGPNPDWFIVTADPQLVKHTPLVHTNPSGVMDGVLVARGQLEFIDGQPSIDPSKQALPATQDEITLGSIDPKTMIDPSSVPCEPIYFYQKDNDFVHHISAIFNELSISISFNYNTNNTLNFLDNSQTHWTNVANNFLINMFPPGFNPINLTSNQIEVKEQMIDTPVQLTSNNLSIEESTIDTSVNLFSNKLSVNESTIDTSVNLLSNKITPKESTISTPVSLVSNEIVTNKETIINHVDIESNKLDIKKKVLKSTANIVSNELHINKQTIPCNADIVSNKIHLNQQTIPCNADIVSNEIHLNHQTVPCTADIVSNNVQFNNETISATANVVSNDLHINEHTIPCYANVLSNDIQFNIQSVPCKAKITSNTLHINEDIVPTTANVVSNDLFINEHTINCSANVISNDIQLNQHTVPCIANITSNTLQVDEEFVQTTANVVSNDLLINEQTIPCSANIMSNDIHFNHHNIPCTANIVSNTLHVNKEVIPISVPHFVVNIREEEIPLNIHFKYPQGSGNKLLTLSNPSYFSHDASFPDGHPQSSHLSHLPSSNYSSTNSYSNAEANDDSHDDQTNTSSASSNDHRNHVNSDDNGDDHTPPPVSLNTTVSPLSQFSWIINELINVNSKSQMRDLISRIRSEDFDTSPLADFSRFDLPIIVQMLIYDRWIGVGQFYCPRCDLTFNNSAALAVHRKSCHDDCNPSQEQSSIEYITNYSLRWKTTPIDDHVLAPQYRTIFTCPFSDCCYVTNRQNALSSHIGSAHPELMNIKHEVGLFWAMHIMHARKTNKLLFVHDLFHDLSGSICRSCNDFIGQDKMTVKQHANRSHPHANLEGHKHLAADVAIKPNWLTEDLDVSDIELAKSDLDKEKLNHISQNSINVTNRTLPVIPKNDDTVDTSVTDKRRRFEKDLRRVHEEGIVKSNEATPVLHLHQCSSEFSDEEDVSQIDAPHDVQHFNITDFLDKADNWKVKCMKLSEDFVRLPKLWGEKLNKSRKKIEEVFKVQIKSTIDWYEYALAHSHNDNLSIYNQMLLCEGLISKVILTLQKSLRSLFMRPRITNNRRPRNLEEPIRLRSATKFIAGIELIHTRLIEEPNPSSPLLNLIADIKDKLSRFLLEAPDDFTQLIGGTDTDAIESLINDDNYDEKIEFLRQKLEALEIESNASKSSKFKKFIQRVYDEDPKRALDWFILNDDTPECGVPVEDFVNSYGASWSDAAALGTDDDNVFQLPRIINDEVNDSLKTMLQDEDLILKTIKSRSNLSAFGCDGLCNAVWKIGGNTTAHIVKHIFTCMLNTGLFPEVIKFNKTIMLYKKGDVNDPHSWRPITITPTLYRIIMCHISRSMQLINSNNRFISSSQKGFMKIPAAAAEHVTMVDEMIHDATRNNKSLYIMSIDFSDAFGSVPHKLIKRNLKSLGFDVNFVKCIMSSYTSSATKIVINDRKSDEIIFRKGVKQGCPLSPTLFNICIDSLISHLSKQKSDGYHWNGISSVVQAYADDVILFSDTEQGMINLISIVERFCSFAGNMVINSKKCQSFSYIVNNGSRNVLNDSFIINNGAVNNISIQGAASYLGLPIAAKSSQRKKHVFKKIEEMSLAVNRITNCSLRFNQAVDAIKRFVLPRLDYELMANTAPVNGLKRLDRLIRGKLSKLVGASGIPVEWFYTSRKDGGLNLQSLCDRQKALTIRLYVGLTESYDRCVRMIIKASDDAEINYRKASIDDSSPFLHIKLKSNGAIDGELNHGTSNLLSRCVKSLFDLNVGLSKVDDAFNLTDLDSDSSSVVHSHNIMKYVMKILHKRYSDKLCKHQSKGHSFSTLINSPISNFFLKPKSLMTDTLTKFAIKARTNSLITGALLSKKSRNTGDPNDNNVNHLCYRCGAVETLHHIINGCPNAKQLFTKRHNTIQDILRNYLMNIKHFNVHSNQVVRGRGSEHLTGDSSSLKPDLWWWEGDRLMIAEFTIPYGMLTNVNGDNISTLTVRRNDKITKYKCLVNDCHSQFHCETKLFVFVISSLGAIPRETLDELKAVTGSNKTALKLAARMAAAALRETMLLYRKWMKRDNDDVDEVDAVTHDSDSESKNSNEEDPLDTDDESPSVNSLSNDAWRDLIDSPSDDALEDPGITPLWNQVSNAISEVTSSDESETVQHSDSQNPI